MEILLCLQALTPSTNRKRSVFGELAKLKMYTVCNNHCSNLLLQFTSWLSEFRDCKQKRQSPEQFTKDVAEFGQLQISQQLKS